MNNQTNNQTNYFNKYLKYKAKYLSLKKQIGSGFKTNYKINSEIPLLETIEQLDTINHNNHIVVPMNGFYIVNESSTDILTTFGVSDCVVVMMYNSKNKNRYMAHYLRHNEFLEHLSNACEFVRDNCNTEPETICDEGFMKISNSLPSWTNDKNTTINIISQSEINKTITRYLQFLRKKPEGTINLYLSNSGRISLYNLRKQIDLGNIDKETGALSSPEYAKGINGEKKVIQKMREILKEAKTDTNLPNNKFIKKWYFENRYETSMIFGIMPNGNIFMCDREKLNLITDNKLFNFYNSQYIKNINVENANKYHKKCVKEYGVKLN